MSALSKGLVFDVRRFSVHDGPGIRTTIFFKGCPLQCSWCHNPESRSREQEQITRTDRMGKQVFPYNETIGQWYSTEELIQEIRKDNIFFGESGGGVTFSGGEPLLQAPFLLALSDACQKEGFHRTLDTCGLASPDLFSHPGLLADLFLFDLKIMDENLHRRYTGQPNGQILENLAILAQGPAEIIIRVPVIPGLNDLPGNSRAMAAFLQQKAPGIRQIHLLPYHSLAKNKFRNLGIEMNETFREPESAEIAAMKTFLENSGFVVKTGG
jgi:pyruvate formate lyase activating enzyme